MKIRAAILEEMGRPAPYAESRPLTISDVELDPPGDGEVLIRIGAAGLCHSDLSVINGNRPRQTPMALGHEAAGEVVECGHGVENLAKGDHVALVFVPSCGRCLPCADGRPALCEPGAAANNEGTLISGAHRIHRNGETVAHHIGVSAFAEYAVVSEYSCVKIDKELSFEEAALFGCAVLTGVGAVINTGRVPPGATTAVIGLGGVGLNALLGAKVSGADRIVAVDIHDDKLKLARELGATDTFNATANDCAERIREATGGGVEFAFEMAGSVQAMDLAYRITRRGGTTVSAGLSHPAHDFSLKHVSLVAEERTIKGSYVGSCVPLRDVPRYVALYRKGLLPVDKLMSGTIGLEGLNEAFDALDSGHTVRQVLVP